MNTDFEKNNIATIKGIVSAAPEFSHSVLGEGFYNLKV